jgi:phage shock protein PspC (stress-responsive transcriptional regulator)
MCRASKLTDLSVDQLRERTSWALKTTRIEPANRLLGITWCRRVEVSHFDVQKGHLEMSLSRPRDDRMIAGVCSGIARHFNLDPTIVRIAFVASLFLPGPQILIYLIAWLLMPDEYTSVA